MKKNLGAVDLLDEARDFETQKLQNIYGVGMNFERSGRALLIPVQDSSGSELPHFSVQKNLASVRWWCLSQKENLLNFWIPI